MPITRRDFLAGAAVSVAAPVPAIDIGGRKQLFVDARLIASQRGVTLRPASPRLPDENLLAADRPWDAARAGVYSHILYDGRFRLWYSAHESMIPFERYGPRARRFSIDRICYAESDDGIRFRKPALGIATAFGSKANNIVLPGSGPCVFQDPFGPRAARYRMLMKGLDGSDPRIVAEWPAAQGMTNRALYMAWSADGLRWERRREPVLPMSIGSQRAVFWDDRIGRWAVYLRGHRTANSFYSRLELEKDAWNQPFPFRRTPGKSYDPERIVLLEDELPVAMDVDVQDPPHSNIYSMNPWKYPGTEDIYIAFPVLWYAPPGSDRAEVQLAVSRDGLHWERPWRQPLFSGAPQREAWPQVWPVPDPAVRGDEVWLYYNALPYRHFDFISPEPGQGVMARAIFGIDRFVAAEARTNGEIITQPLRFSGRSLRVNADAGRSGSLRVGIQTSEGRAIAGFTESECEPITGDRTAAVTWRSSLKRLAGVPVRLRFQMESCRLYAFQFHR